MYVYVYISVSKYLNLFSVEFYYTMTCLDANICYYCDTSSPHNAMHSYGNFFKWFKPHTIGYICIQIKLLLPHTANIQGGKPLGLE